MSIKSLFFESNSFSSDGEFLNTRAPIRAVPELIPTEPRINGNHAYLELGDGKPIIFCHGLFGGIYNISSVAKALSSNYRFIMPFLPMYDLRLIDCTITRLGQYLSAFIRDLNLNEAIIIGSSLGGGTALSYALERGNKIKGLVLCGSSGLSTIPLSKGFFKRKNIDFVREATRDIFFNREVPPEDMVQDVFITLQSYEAVIRSIRFTKAATRALMTEELQRISAPTLLVWGRDDPITPVDVAPKFQSLLPNAKLFVIEECGHVPTQEKPEEFLFHLKNFLKELNY